MKRSTNLFKHSGFTLVELLVAMAIIFILAGLAVSAYRINQEKTYYTLSETALVGARQALEAGLINQEEFGPWTSMWQDTPGEPKTASGRKLAPGLTVPKDSVVYVRHKGDCAEPTCLEDYIYARHCDAKTYIYWYRLKNGTEMLMENVLAHWQCS